jgi:putative membrane protein
MNHRKKKRDVAYPLTLLALLAVIWVLFAIDPLYRSAWFLESLFILFSVPALVFTYEKIPLSKTSATCLFIFFVIHTIGGHYTYAEVPIGYWMQDWFGFSRNHFDRVAHFAFGLLLVVPIRELLLPRVPLRRGWRFWLPLEAVIAGSAMFEVIEWLLVAVTKPETGILYLGTQGDVWDAQWDMALAWLGAAITLSVIWVRERRSEQRSARLPRRKRIS